MSQQISQTNYVFIYAPTHPSANDKGYVREHIIIAEQILGRSLKPSETVHHIDFDKSNNKKENLMIFKTNNDHTRFHAAVKNDLSYNLKCENMIFECEIVYSENDRIRHSEICPVCGKKKSKGSNYCRQCYRKIREKNPNIPILKTELQSLITLYSFTTIGKMYNVTGNAVKKWCKRYDIYQSKIHEAPNRNELIDMLLNNSINETARYYEVDKDTINRWIRIHNITIIPEKILCINTNEEYFSIKEACNKKYSQYNYELALRKIHKAIKTSTCFEGLEWKKLPKQVY